MRRAMVWVILVGFGMAVSGCTSMQQPSVYPYPKKGQSTEQMTRDDGECKGWAQRQTGFDPGADTAKGVGLGALIGAVGGAAAGAAIGAATGHAGTGAAVGAAAGGLGGAAVGGGVGYTKSKEGYEKAYTACMTARGYEIAR